MGTKQYFFPELDSSDDEDDGLTNYLLMPHDESDYDNEAKYHTP